MGHNTDTYTKVPQDEANEGGSHISSPSSLSSRKWQLSGLVVAFIVGSLISATFFGSVVFFKSGSSTTSPFVGRKFPEFREGTDQKTGLPLSWSHGDCGNSAEDARSRGCRFSVVLHAWLPPDCLTNDDIEDEKLMYESRTWPYQTDDGKNLTMEELHKGDFHHFTTLFDWHVTHCMYVWKRFHRVMLDAEGKIDSYTANIHHTNHCVKMIGGSTGGMKDSGTKIFVKYPVCA